jgi:hypothetical protein
MGGQRYGRGPVRRVLRLVEVQEEPASDAELFLASEGWHIEWAGTTGTPLGRPRTGVVGPDFIGAVGKRIFLAADGWLIKRLIEVLGPAYFGTKRDRQRAFREARNLFIACLLAANINTKALADLNGLNDSTVRGWRRDGEAWIADNLLPLLLTVPDDGSAPLPRNIPAKSPKGGEEEMNATMAAEIIERLERIEESAYRIELRQLDEQEQERDDVESLDD